MTIAIYGRITRNTKFEIIIEFLHYLKNHGIQYYIFDDYAQSLLKQKELHNCIALLEPRFSNRFDLPPCNFIFSIGGDGTILDTVRILGERSIPIVGVNVGRLGFLASVNQNELKTITEDLLRNAWKPDHRSLICLHSNPDTIFKDCNYALNEVTIHKANSNEMIIIHTYINGEFMNSYWADGLIVATPTGSTAYSLACGGPIITPQASIFVITPIAPHSLTVRPFIIPDNNIISFEIESRSGQALVALDNRNELIQDNFEIALKKSSIHATLVKFSQRSYFSTLRDRLNWGVDSRN